MMNSDPFCLYYYTAICMDFPDRSINCKHNSIFSIRSMMKMIHCAYTIIQQFVWIRLIGQLIVNILCIYFFYWSMMKVIHFAYTIIQQFIWIRLIQVGQLIKIEYIFFLSGQ